MSAKRIAILGSTGQLGTELVDVLRQDDKFDVLALSHAEADCANAKAVYDVLISAGPRIVVNCAASVRVDDCEDHPEDAFRVNAAGALNVARACTALDALCVYISTDYVFDGAKATPYVEPDPAFPVNVYGVSKLAGECLVRQAAPRWLIVRTASLFGKTGARGKGGNFVETVIARAKAGETLKVVNDVRMSPTYARDAATGLAALLDLETTGIVHLTNDGACSWYEFAQLALKLMALSAPLIPISSGQYLNRARRPANSALRSERFLVKLRPWQEGLKAYLIEKGHIAGRQGRRDAIDDRKNN
ncbi:MAG: dTDP-4-dehydrorhamnose reductase [Chloroflexota bacterium]